MAKKTTKKTTGTKAASTKKAGRQSSGKSKKKTTKKKTTKKSKTAKKSVTNKKSTKASAGTKITTKVSSSKKKPSISQSRSTSSSPKSGSAFKPASGPKPGSAAAGVVVMLDPNIDIREVLPDAQLRKIKHGLSKKELTEFHRLLLGKRAEIIGDYKQMEEFRNAKDGGEVSHMPLHMADVGSDNYEQEFTLGLMESERRLLQEIEDALMRIENKTYGICVVTGQPINRERLEAKPWAKYCIEVARERERLGLAG